MRTPAIALISLLQCANTVGDPYRPWNWSDGERIAYLYPNGLLVFLTLVCIYWALYRYLYGLPILADSDPESDPEYWSPSPDERARMDRQARDYARRNRIY